MEDATAALVRCLREAFASDGRSQIVLGRVFQTMPWEALPADLRDFVTGRLAPEGATPQRCLSLLATEGELTEWCDRRRSRDHQAIPLSSAESLTSTPMVAALVDHLGVSLDTFLHGEETLIGDDREQGFEVFFVPDAAESAAVPAKNFVGDHGVRSVLGFGGVLPGGDVFTVILFTRIPVSDQVAGMFRTVAVAAKLALLRAVERPLFVGQQERPADPLAVASARIGALEQMLDVQQQTVVSQSARLESALDEALTSRHHAEREAEANEALREITSLLSAELDLDRLVQAATDAATRVTGASFGAFFYNVVKADGEQFMLYTLSGAPRSAFDRFPQPRATQVFAPTFHGVGIVRSDDITTDVRYGHNAPYRGIPEGHLPVRSYLAVPVISRSGEVHGGFFFGHPEIAVFDERAEALAVGIAAQAAIALDNVRLYQAERDTALALQRSLLLQEVDVPDGLEAAYEYLPGGAGHDVGGDWFDVIPLNGGRTAFVIGDVMGRGVHAAAIMGQLRTAVRAYAVSDLPPGLLMSQLNRLVTDMGDDLIATCAYAILDQTEGTLTLANSGHLPPAFVRPDGGVSLLEQSLGPPLGVPGAVHLEHQLDFPAGTRMLLYTDGLVEHRNRTLGEGLAALQEQLHTIQGSSDLLCKQIVAALSDAETQDDDVTLLMVTNVGLDRVDYASRNFPPDPREARKARRFVDTVLREWGDHEQAESVVMAVNELFINAVSHANTPVTLRLRRLPDLIVAEMEDLDGHRPRRTVAQPEDENHRGLQIVEILSSRWGSRVTDSGKVVWAEFEVQPEPALNS